MAWEDRLRKGTYTHPEIDRIFEFQFDSLSRSGDHKHSIDEIPQSNFAIVQDFGMEATKFPMAIYFSGPDYDATADAFYATLAAKGPGILSHPRWGDVKALPVSFTQNEEFVSGMGRAVFDVQWIRAEDAQYLVTKEVTASGLASGVDSAQTAAAGSLAASWGVPSLKDIIATKQAITTAMRSLTGPMGKLTGQVATLSQIVNANISSVIRDIDTLILSPLTLAQAIQRAVTTAASSADLTPDAKVNAYRDFFNSLRTITPKSATEAATKSLIAQSTGMALALSASAGTPDSRSKAIQARDTITQTAADIHETISAWERSTGYVMRPEDYASLTLLTAGASALLLETSFSLRTERIVITEYETTVLDLIYRFYGSINAIDEFCEQNHLTGNESLVVPSGKEIRYYVG